MIIENAKFSLLWGDSSLMVRPEELDELRAGKPLEGKPWDTIHDQIPALGRLFFAHQVHGGMGHLVSADLVQNNPPWKLAGDYLITDTPGIGIGVLTADCLPIIIYDPAHHACSVVHAGWRSSVAGIVGNAIAHMNEAFGSDPAHLKLYFGPCAGSCCYEVTGQLMSAVGADAQLVTERCGDATYFDLAGYNKLQAIRVGVNPQSIDMSESQCTICNPEFCSWRRGKEKAGRQVSIICLKKV